MKDNEITKTLIFAALGIFFAIAAYATLPRTVTVSKATGVGDNIFPDFQPLDAASLEIAKYDEQTGETKKFSVAKKNGYWVIPSHNDYPADANTQLGDASGALLNLKILENRSERKEDYADYGVVEPSDDNPGQKGVGMLVSLKDGDGNSLAKLIIGKQASVDGEKDGSEGPRHYFVRRADQPYIFVTKIDPSPFKTDFADWIEKDLLKLNGWDISKVTIKDYSLIFQQDNTGRLNVGRDRRMDAVVGFNDQQSSWTLDSMTLFGPMNEPIAAGLGDYEELNTQKLNDLKFAVDDLKIVNVLKKPEGLSASLTADEKFVENQEAVMSLVEKGFLPHDGEILARNGEVHITTKEGVLYILRFGEIDRDSSDAKTLNRNLFVTTRVDENQIPEPKYAPEPMAPANLPVPEGAPAEDKKEGEAAKEGEKKEPEVPGLSDTQRAELERIKKANQRLKDEYSDKLKKAQARSAELNAHFAKWYYVVAEDTYKKIHLGRSDIVKESAKAREEGFGVDAFRELEKQGLK